MDRALELHSLVVSGLRQLHPTTEDMRLGHQRASVLAQLDPVGRQRRCGYALLAGQLKQPQAHRGLLDVEAVKPQPRSDARHQER